MYSGRKIAKLTIFAFIMLVLILRPQCGLEAALNSIDLCLRSVIPGMFPLLFLSSLLAGELCSYSLPFIETILHIPTGSAGFFLIGLVCGYPVGAKLLQNEINKINISSKNATRMIIFCNNASPAFIIGILSPIFSSVWYAIAIWLIQIIASIIVGILLPGHIPETISKNPLKNTSSGAIMIESIKAIATICGWIILFGILLAYLNTPMIQYLNSVPKVILSGILELTNGMHALQHIYSPSIRFMVCSILLSLGGLCILLQTKSVAPSVCTKKYICGRLFHASITGTLASIFSYKLFPTDTASAYCLPLFLSILVMALLILYFSKKMVAITRNV